MAIVLLFKQQREQEKIKALETSRLQHELKYLKAQINPHFFMNTLNNIHGTVGIDPAKAQEMILELSKMMRYILYEGKDKVVPLSSEIGFIQCYTSLMKRRYPENKVTISMDLPESTPAGMTVAPLLFMSFIENAFKHEKRGRTKRFFLFLCAGSLTIIEVYPTISRSSQTSFIGTNRCSTVSPLFKCL